MLFGEIGAPAWANYVIRLAAEDHRHLYPLVSSIVDRWFYICFHTFVGNRVAEIDDTLACLKAVFGEENICFWYVPTALNPVDDAKRGLPLGKITAASRWQRGPDFVYEAEEKWPERRFEKVAEPQEECKQVKWVGVLQEETKPDLFQLTKYSSFSKLRCVVAYVYQFINNARSLKSKRVSGVLKV